MKKAVLFLAAVLSNVFGVSVKANTLDQDSNLLGELNESDLQLGSSSSDQPVLDTSLIYKDKSLMAGAVSFLTEKDIPFTVRSIDMNNTIISIMKEHQITLSTQRWRAGDTRVGR